VSPEPRGQDVSTKTTPGVVFVYVSHQPELIIEISYLSGLCFKEIFDFVGSYVCLSFVNINQQTYKQERKKPFLSKQKPVDGDGFCEDQDAFCDAVSRNWVQMDGNCENAGRFLGAT
jgi:hypothetical protein